MVHVGRFICSHRQVFGIKKIGTKSCQYCPYLINNREKIPHVKIDDSFAYLGKDFNFSIWTAQKLKTILLMTFGSI